MSIKDLLVHLDVTKDGGHVQAFAISLASELGAHLTAAGVVIEVMPTATSMGEFPYDAMLEVAEQARVETQRAYDDLCKALPAIVASELVTIDTVAGQAREKFGRLARHFDLAIVGQEGPDSGPDNGLMAEAALFGSGRPIFLVPYIHRGAARLGKAMIAWDGGMAAARAVADALPLLKRAGRVDVVSILPKGQAADELPGFNITRHLARHDIAANLKTLPYTDETAAALLNYAADSAADYMVMGGYGHSRLREFILGGVTREIFRSTTLPTFMAH